MLKRFLLIALCLLLAACGRAPDTDALRADVERGLAATYGAGLFRIDDLKRMGSAADSSAPAGETLSLIHI